MRFFSKISVIGLLSLFFLFPQITKAEDTCAIDKTKGEEKCNSISSNECALAANLVPCAIEKGTCVLDEPRAKTLCSSLNAKTCEVVQADDELFNDIFCKVESPPVPAAENGSKVELETSNKNKVYLINPIGGISDGTDAQKAGVTNLPKIVGGVMAKLLGILGALALLVFVYGGFEWVTAAGNADKVSTGGAAMTWAAIGICIIFSSYAIINLVLNTITSGASGTDTSTGGEEKFCYCFAAGDEERIRIKKYDGKEDACKAITGKTVGVSDFDGEVKDCQWK